MNREVLDKWCERGILGLVLIILVFGPLAMGAIEPPYFLAVQALTVAVLLLWIARLWLSPRPQLLWPPICWAVLAFALYAIGRYFFAELEYLARLELVRVLIYAFLFLAILNNLYRQEHTQLLILTLVFLAMAISSYAIYQFVSGSDKVWIFVKKYPHRGTGTFLAPNVLAGFLEMVLPLGLAWTLTSRAKPVMRILVGYASLVVLGGIAVTVSRGGWAATTLVLMVFFCLLIRNRIHRLPSIVLLVVLVGVGLFFIPRTQFFKARLMEIASNDQFNDSSRFDLWGPAVTLWKQNVWWGIGPNHFNSRFRAYRPETEQRQPDRVHNDYLNTLTDWGIVGAALVLAAWIVLYAGAFKTWRYVQRSAGDLGGRNSNKFALVLGTSLGLLAILIHSVVDFNMHIPANAILAITLMAIVSSTLRFATDRYWFTARPVIRVMLTLLLVAGISYLVPQGVRFTRENVALAKAERAPAFSPEQVAALKTAFAVEPNNAATALAIGRGLRAQCWESGDVELATEAMEWFKRSTERNPYDGYGYLEYGICLDWPLERQAEARTYFDRAVQLDRNGYYTVAYMGWHYFQTGDYAAAREWFERSRRIAPDHNQLADSYLPLTIQKLLEAAAGGGPNGGLVPVPSRNPN